MLEFRADPESQYHNAEFQKDKTVPLIVGRADALLWWGRPSKRWATTPSKTSAVLRTSWTLAWRPSLQARECPMRERIAHLEAEIEDLCEAVDRCRKISIAANAAIGAGALALVTGGLRVFQFGPTMFVIALRAILGGIAPLVSNKPGAESNQSASTLEHGEPGSGALNLETGTTGGSELGSTGSGSSQAGRLSPSLQPFSTARCPLMSPEPRRVQAVSIAKSESKMRRGRGPGAARTLFSATGVAG